MKRWLSITSLVFVSILGSACQQVPIFQDTKGPKPIKHVVKTTDNPVELTDIPLPEGFVYNADRSFRHHTNFQASRLYYEKSTALTDLGKLVTFFEAELTKQGWKVQFVYGKRTRYVVAEKDGESCEIVLAQKFRQRRTILVVKRTGDGNGPS
ncbi:MAG: hypothetical protein P1V97_35975 [Planctomycetota bacterium]|nr:hypothetical protein [Planctomycetota bacterium]